MVKAFLGAGSIHSRKRGERWAKVHSYHLDGHRQLARVLPKLVRNLFVKQPQAELVLDYCQERLKKGTRPLDDEDIERVERLRQINRRGSDA